MGLPRSVDPNFTIKTGPIFVYQIAWQSGPQNSTKETPAIREVATHSVTIPGYFSASIVGPNQQLQLSVEMLRHSYRCPISQFVEVITVLITKKNIMKHYPPLWTIIKPILTIITVTVIDPY